MKWILALFILVFASVVSLVPVSSTSSATFASVMPGMPLQGYVPQMYSQQGYQPYNPGLNYLPQSTYGYQPQMMQQMPSPYTQSVYNPYMGYAGYSPYTQYNQFGYNNMYTQQPMNPYFQQGYPSYGYPSQQMPGGYPSYGGVQPNLLNSFGPLLSSLLMNRGSGAPVAPAASYSPYYPSSNYPSYDDHSQYCETCHTSRRQPVARYIDTTNTPSRVAPVYDSYDDSTEARYANTTPIRNAPTRSVAPTPAPTYSSTPVGTVYSSPQPAAIAQSGMDRVAQAEADDDHDHDHDHDEEEVAKPVVKVVAKPAPAPPTKAPPKVAPAKQETGTHTNPDNLPAPSSKTVLTPRSSQEANSQTQPVWETFADEWRACAPAGCEPYNYASKRTDAGKSCHNSGRAIDVHAMICPSVQNGKSVMVIDRAINSRKFQDVVSCVQGRKKMKVLWHNKPYSQDTVTSGHYDHAHFSITCLGGTYW